MYSDVNWKGTVPIYFLFFWMSAHVEKINKLQEQLRYQSQENN